MRLRSLVSGSFLIFVAGALGCSSPDPFYGPAAPVAGSGSGADGGGSGASGQGNGGGGNGGGGNGGSDASVPSPVPSGSDAGSSVGADTGAPTGGGTDSGSTTADAAPPNDGFDEFQHRNLDDINKFRATLNVAPLVLDKQLCTFAAAGSLELSQDHTPHQHFINASNNGTLWTSGFNSTAAENQGDPNGWTKLASDPTQNELQQIDAIQQAMFDEGPGTGEAHGHYTNMMDATSKRVGVGLLEVNGMLYLTNDFSQ